MIRWRSILVQFSFIVILPMLQCLGNTNSFKFHHLTVDDGLSQGTVLAIFQDSQGFIWFGTQDGLNRYDGKNFKIYKYNPTDSASISDNFIRTICEDSSKNLWIGTLNGLNKFNLLTEKFIRYTRDETDINSISSNDIFSIYVDQSNNIWIGTRGGGLNYFNQQTQKFTRYQNNPANPNSLRGKSVSAIYQDKHGILWLGTTGGFQSYDPKKNIFQFYPSAEGVWNRDNDNVVNSICEGENNMLWLGTYSGGILQFSKNNKTFKRHTHNSNNKNSLSSNTIFRIYLDTNSKLWVGTEHRLNVLDIKSEEILRIFSEPTNPSSLSNDNIQSIFEDRGGIFWIGTYGSGINKYNPSLLKFYHIKNQPEIKNSLNNNSVWCFYEDAQGALWIGTDEGLNQYEPTIEKWSAFTHNPNNPNSLSGNITTSVCEDELNNLWIGTRDGGVNRFDRKYKKFSHFLKNIIVLKILPVSATCVWIGSDGDGLIKFNPLNNEVKYYRNHSNDPNSISNNSVGEIFRDRAGNLWIGTYGSGLNRFEQINEKFIRYQHDQKNPNSISNDLVTSTYEDNNGILWIGTAQGLNKFNPKDETFTRYFENDGLPNDFIYGILQDKNGNLWISTNKGLSRFNENTSDHLGNIFKNYDFRDGLQSNEFNAGAYYRCKHGEMFSGGPNGFNRFFPENIQSNPNIPPIAITAFKKLEEPVRFDKSLCAVDCIELSYTDYYFTFEFAALDFSDPIKNQYEYFLEGFDPPKAGWIYAGRSNVARYTNINPGEYTFRVRGSNNDGVWNKTGTSIKINIHPPFWRTWWFISLMALTLIATGFGVYNYRVNKLLEIERLRRHLASDLHDELATNLSSIAMFSNIVKENPQQQSGLLERITTLAKESVDAVRDIIWTLDTKQETIESLLTRLHDITVINCRAKNIQLKFDLPVKDILPSFYLQPETHRNLWLLLKEAVNNSCKHSGCSEILIETMYSSGLLNIRIKDNGNGFDPSTKSVGKGLETMKMRAEELGGKLQIDSQPGKGTEILFQWKIKK
ncbi:MAG: two-component regulator propeller domain-containing protein [Bacteroidota bacterium]|nr:two-component regulator propeller domain-containing protein [Bacteroidota bacterium]